MPRKARQVSCSGFFHVIVRGIGKQILFEDKSDYLYYLYLLEKNSKCCSVRICAYCLMENHVHLLLFDQNRNLSLFMKKTGISYALYFNGKYERTGHLLQDRYKSEPVESENYLLTVFRYILKNPEKAAICPASEYEWSSYHCYGHNNTFVDTDVLSGLIGDIVHYQTFISEEDDDVCLEYNQVRMTDSDAISIIKQLGFENGIMISSLPREERDNTVKMLLISGVSIRQIERLTGISRGVVQNIKKK